MLYQDEHLEVGVWECTPGTFPGARIGYNELMVFVKGAARSPPMAAIRSRSAPVPSTRRSTAGRRLGRHGDGAQGLRDLGRPRRGEGDRRPRRRPRARGRRGGALLDELVEQLDRTRKLLTEGPEGAARPCCAPGRRSAEESQLVAQLAQAAPLADPTGSARRTGW